MSAVAARGVDPSLSLYRLLDPEVLANPYPLDYDLDKFLYYLDQVHPGVERMLLSVAAHNVRARRCYDALGFTTLGSHWDAHIGPDVTGEARFSTERHLFRRGPLGLESLFYDMRLDHEEWRSRV